MSILAGNPSAASHDHKVERRADNIISLNLPREGIEVAGSDMSGRGAPGWERVAGSLDRLFRFGNAGFSDCADNFIGRARIDRGNRFAGAQFFAVDDERIFPSKAHAHFAQSGAHFILVRLLAEVCQWRVFVSIARRSLTGTTMR